LSFPLERQYTTGSNSEISFRSKPCPTVSETIWAFCLLAWRQVTTKSNCGESLLEYLNLDYLSSRKSNRRSKRDATQFSPYNSKNCW